MIKVKRLAGIIGTPFFYLLVLIAVLVFLVFQLAVAVKRIIARVPKGSLARVILVFSLSLLIFVMSSTFFWVSFIKDLPSAHALTTRSIDISTKIYDRNGKLLYSLYKDKNRTLIKLSDVPIHVRLATIAAEDVDFYNHPGISLKGIARAVYKLAHEGKVTGGSTITQQLVKNAFLSPDKTVARKLREIFISLAVEQKYTKDQILEMYLNEVGYGGTAYGIQEASRQYFDKDVENLSLSEAAFLAGLPKSPTLYFPFGSKTEAGFARQKEVLTLMRQAGFISESQLTRALSEKVVFGLNKTDIKAPHFVMYVRELLDAQYGEEFTRKSGLHVTTTLDLDLQEYAQKVLKDELMKLSNLNVTNGAVLILNPRTGEILAMVGSKDYFDLENDGNLNVVFRPRQPGSSIKVVNYAYALSNGMTAATVIDDSPVSFKVEGQPPYIPKNYDGGFRGKVSLRSALAESRNIPAVKVLAQTGVINMIEMGKMMGITSWKDPSLYGLSLTLGGGDVTLYELATVYATLANQGLRPRVYAIEKIATVEAKIMYKQEPSSQAALDPRVAFILTDILRDNDARSPAFGSYSALAIPGHREIAVKTGTSNDLRDNLTIGYNQNYLVAVWVGNNNNSPMSRIASGLSGASSVWNAIMTTLVADADNHPWDTPEGLIQKKICGRDEWFLMENAPDIRCPRPQSDEQERQVQE